LGPVDYKHLSINAGPLISPSIVYLQVAAAKEQKRTVSHNLKNWKKKEKKKKKKKTM
jgi:hypothetical protein